LWQVAVAVVDLIVLDNQVLEQVQADFAAQLRQQVAVVL
jgi:hypothetical protein